MARPPLRNRYKKYNTTKWAGLLHPETLLKTNIIDEKWIASLTYETFLFACLFQVSFTIQIIYALVDSDIVLWSKTRLSLRWNRISRGIYGVLSCFRSKLLFPFWVLEYSGVWIVY
ncbi:hypothetical protein BDQ94DRAFT_136717 [Aspergillus welwitschiae]|uniref:Uncharacterized protein n=1 Tax=Aspergillus welwitschiae TaxID=1341132 RepID=A0A3F3QEE6_9EURO|nr:hypothetical protein BDQ94DRAFT_136717 [Aspergillus welwitschiae]RDH37603.1 hypothetical protein BDQ94DRAFT_136717 [Aspergillus welwitschiae]